jgi:hypothetical protein
MSKENYFTQSDLNAKPREDFKLQLVQIDGEVYESTVLMRKTFLGMFPRWVPVGDLLEPVRDVDEEIAKAKLKVKQLEDKREQTVLEARALASSLASFDKRPLPFTDKPSKSKSATDVFSIKKPDKDKPKSRTVVLDTVPAKPQQNNQQKGKGNH